MTSIRILTTDDAAAYQALRLRGLRETPDAFGSSYEEEVDRPLEMIAERLAGGRANESVAYGAFDAAGTLVGIGGLYRETHRKARHRANVVGMYVAPEARGQALGRALLDALVAHARSMGGVQRLELGVTTTNAAARALYRAFGFTTWG
ncbi:MAG TPA: GNAT family N-acetyltransferase, partial [Longimicrobium sp.]|nr:GNAT family N-acetyltransferase [Longimicrobium sp.]